MTETKSEKILRQVRALIAKADSTDEPGEADVFRAKADELMAKYAIEQWQVQVGHEQDRPKPEIRQVDFEWWMASPRKYELWTLFHDVARHCRCVVAMRGYGESSHGGSYRTMPVIGLPSDLDYMDLMFTQLMVEMIRRIDPQVQPGESLAEAVYRLRFAGLGWERLTQRVWDAGLAKPLRGEHYTTRTYGGEREVITAETPFVKLPTDYWQRVKKNLAVLNRKHVAEHGLPRNYTKPEVYQRSFAEGFVREIARRLRAMREQREHRQTNGMELALVEVRQQAVNLYREVWPEPEPVEVKSSKRRSRAVVKELAFDLNAYGDGARAGAEVDLSNKTSSRVSGGRGSLPSGS